MPSHSANSTPVVTLALVGVIVTIGLGTMLVPQPDLLLQTGANIPRAIRQQGEVYRLLTYVVLHAGLWHLLLNANLFFFLGLSLEYRVGHRALLVIFLIGSLFGGLSHALLADDNAAGLGVSTALYAIIGADSVLLYRQRATLTPLECLYSRGIFALAGAGLIVGLMLEAGWFTLPLHAGNWGHLGGLLTGILLGCWFSRSTECPRQ